jgi:hypothetical protein
MQVWRHFTDLLVLMISEHERIFEEVNKHREIPEVYVVEEQKEGQEGLRHSGDAGSLIVHNET